MSDLQDKSSRNFEIFSYRPDVSSDQITEQVSYIVSKGWNPTIEHTESENASGSCWYIWKLPMFGETDVDRVLAEAEAAHKAHPDNYIRLIGYDDFSQSQGDSLVIYLGTSA